jgi:hypothetical protein
LWHESHSKVFLAIVALCPAGLRFGGETSAALIWQVEHLPAADASWFQVAGSHAKERWQSSQDLVALLPLMCVEGLELESLPLWQVWQPPRAALAWL